MINFHRVFVISLILKGLLASFEVLSGIAIFFIPHNSIIEFVREMNEAAFGGWQKEFIKAHLLRFSLSSQHFAGFYLLSHGVVKLWLVTGLLKNKLWYCPVSLVVFGMLALYQFYRVAHTHSIMLLLFTLFDCFVLALIWHEYRIKSLR